MRFPLIAVSLLAASVATAACVRYVAVQAPDAAPAPMYDEQKLHTAMTDMAVRVREIRMVLSKGSPPSPEARAELARLLDEIDRIATRLSPDDIRATHPALAFSLDEFLGDVRMSKRAVAAEPPDYFLVGTISGACAACHGNDAAGIPHASEDPWRRK